jgi:DNA-binding NtrC family response regulator
MKTTYKIVIADDEPDHGREIRELIDRTVRFSAGSLGLAAGEEFSVTPISKPSEVKRLAEQIRAGHVEYPIMIADVFMPLRDGDPDTSIEGGWMKLYGAVKELAKTNAAILDEILLIAVTGKSVQAQRVRDIIRKETQAIQEGNARALARGAEPDRSPWTTMLAKPATSFLRSCLNVNPAELLDKESWIKVILNSVRRYKNKKYRSLFIGECLNTLASHSVPFQGIMARAQQLARGNEPVLITGETGVGKEVVANAIHQLSERCDAPFVAQNINAESSQALSYSLFGYEKGAFTGADQSTPGWFEDAGHGTLFIDEVGANRDLTRALDTMLRNVIEARTFRRKGGKRNNDLKCRLILGGSALSDLDRICENHPSGLSKDMIARLIDNRISIPLLRERREDVVPLAKIFLERASVARDFPKVLTPEAERLLTEYEWPGNVRELKKVVTRLYEKSMDADVLSEEVLKELLPPPRADDGGPALVQPGHSDAKSPAGPVAAFREFTAENVKRALEEVEGHASLAAPAFGREPDYFCDLIRDLRTENNELDCWLTAKGWPEPGRVPKRLKK